jgi:hypothetical protein
MTCDIEDLDPDDLLRTPLSLSLEYALSAGMPNTYERILARMARNVARTTRVTISRSLYLEVKSRWLFAQGKRREAMPYLEKRLGLPYREIEVEALHVGILASAMYKTNPTISRVVTLYRTYLARFVRKMRDNRLAAIRATVLILRSWLSHRSEVSEKERNMIAAALDCCSKALDFTPSERIRGDIVRWINVVGTRVRKGPGVGPGRR